MDLTVHETNRLENTQLQNKTEQNKKTPHVYETDEFKQLKK